MFALWLYWILKLENTDELVSIKTKVSEFVKTVEKGQLDLESLLISRTPWQAP